jgi:hypothetical protein
MTQLETWSERVCVCVAWLILRRERNGWDVERAGDPNFTIFDPRPFFFLSSYQFRTSPRLLILLQINIKYSFFDAKIYT